MGNTIAFLTVPASLLTVTLSLAYSFQQTAGRPEFAGLLDALERAA